MQHYSLTVHNRTVCAQQLLLLEAKSISLRTIYSILLKTKLEKAAQKRKGKEKLNLSWKVQEELL